MEKALVMNAKDNVATAIVELEPGGVVLVSAGFRRLSITVSQRIPFGHKFAIRPIEKGSEVIKYGESIGRSTVAIDVGQHVHTHNIESIRGRTA